MHATGIGSAVVHVDRAGGGRRRVEPYRLVATGRRWYLVACDVDREDWRTFRLDRMRDVRASACRFTVGDTPNPADYVKNAISRAPYQQSRPRSGSGPRSTTWGARIPTHAG